MNVPEWRVFLMIGLNAENFRQEYQLTIFLGDLKKGVTISEMGK